jgi:hypothetical protein
MARIIETHVWTDLEIDIDLDQDIDFSLDFHQHHYLLHFPFLHSIPLATMKAAPNEPHYPDYK